MPSNDQFDSWFTSEQIGTSHLHLHALGAISLLYNRLEHAMCSLFSDYVATNRSIGDIIYSRLSNRERIDVLRELVHLESDEMVRDCTLHAIGCFEICAENRNTLMHMIHDHAVDADGPLWGKKRSSDKTRDVFYSMSVAELRAVANDIATTYTFVVDVSVYIFRRECEARKIKLNAMMPDHWHEKPNTLPQKPQKPRKLSPLPPLEDR